MVQSLRPASTQIVDSRRAWIAACGIALANGIAFGTVYTFSTFFKAMSQEFEADSGSTALLFALTLFLFFSVGMISGPISDRFGPAPVFAVGGTIFALGLVLTSFAGDIRVGYLTAGLTGFGAGCFVAPLTGAAGGLFQRRRAAALGLVAAGNGLGTMLLIPAAAALIDANGWRPALRWLAVIAAVGFGLAFVMLVRPPARPARATPQTMRALVSNRNFVTMFIGATLMSVALFSAFGFFVPFTEQRGISAGTASLLFSVIGLASIVGRLALTSVSDRIGALRLMQLMMVLQPSAYAIWIVVDSSLAGLVVFSLVLGVTYGGFVAISPEVSIVLFGLDNVGRLMGLLFLSFGIGGLIGPGLAGWLSDQRGQDSVIAGFVVVTSLAVMVILQTRDEHAATSTS